MNCNQSEPQSHFWNEDEDVRRIGKWVMAAQPGDVYHCPHCGEPIKQLISAATLGAKGGSSTSPAKRAASAANGKQGGRPRKQKP